jgi:hypothetical protein
VNRIEILILVSLASAALIVLIGAGLLVVEAINAEPAPTLPLATVPPHPLLLTRAPLCRDVLSSELDEGGWYPTVTLDAQQGVLLIEMTVALTGTESLPADQIWGAFEAALAGRAGGCSGYRIVVVQVGSYRAEVSADDLLAWEVGALDDSALGERVELSQ